MKKTRERPQGFSRERASRRPLHAKRKPIYEGDVEGNIAKIDQNLKASATSVRRARRSRP